VLHDLGSSVPKSLSDLYGVLAPPQLDFDINTTMNALKSMPDGTLSASGQWKAFNKELTDQSGGESPVFKLMTHIFDNIVEAIIANSNLKLPAKDCSVNLDQNPSRALMSAARYNATRPNSYLLLKDKFNKMAISWVDIALSCEYKWEDGMDELDDTSILLGF
ncbi:hypothetical protein BS47DRAFT_1417726, partial [Hydnum rufescens UP504]